MTMPYLIDGCGVCKHLKKNKKDELYCPAFTMEKWKELKRELWWNGKTLHKEKIEGQIGDYVFEVGDNDFYEEIEDDPNLLPID